MDTAFVKLDSVDFETADGIFIKTFRVPLAGTLIPQHSHLWDHTTLLATGAIEVWKGGTYDRQYLAPATIFIERGTKHTFKTLADATVLACIHNLHGEQAIAILAQHELTDEIDRPLLTGT